MIHALDLIWIVPLSVVFGYFIAAMMVATKEKHLNKGGKHGINFKSKR